MKSNLDLIKETDSFPYPNEPKDAALSEAYTLLHRSSNYSIPIPVGLLLPSILNALAKVPVSLTGEIELSPRNHTITAFFQETEAQRSAAIATVCSYWRENQTFEVLKGWRNELYPVYGEENELLFNVERSAACLFGINTYGVHMSCYTLMSAAEKEESGSKHDLKMWIPRRDRNKQTFGGMLDNTVAGGIASGETPFESLVREADEEASLPSSLVRKKCVEAPMVTYIYLREPRCGGETGLLQPEAQYIYDLELPENVVPKPKDGEVECFYLWTVEEVQEHLAKGEFKPNCALVVLDFFIRHGILMRENESDFEEIEKRCHRNLEFPGPHKKSV